MTSFSTLSTALSALTTQRAALDVAGQNVANVNTVGYTRQRAETASVSAIASASRFSSGLPVGQGDGPGHDPGREVVAARLAEEGVGDVDRVAVVALLGRRRGFDGARS